MIWLIGERGHLILPSTRQTLKEGGFNLKNLHGYIYSRWSKWYIGSMIKYIFPLSSRWFRKKIAERYYGKILTQEQAEKIINHDHTTHVHSHQLEKVIPYPIARNLILNGPPDICIYECACRNSRRNPCKPTKVCMIVGQPFVDFTIEHKPEDSQRISKDEALKILREEHERGHVHTAWFKDLCLDRFFAICNCCKCCCGGIEAMMKYSMPMLISSGFSAKVDKNKCNGCGICERVCPFNAPKVVDGKSQINTKKCMGCEVCKDKCPEKAITLFLDKTKPDPLEIDKL